MLKSPEDIAAWIEERKRRFPTQARIDENKKAMEEAKKAREEAARQRNLQKEENKRLQKEAKEGKARQAHAHKESQNETGDPADAAAKAKQKAEKLRQKLMKEEKRAAKAEADAERARLKAAALPEAAVDNEEFGRDLSVSTQEHGLKVVNGEPQPTTDDQANVGSIQEAQVSGAAQNTPIALDDTPIHDEARASSLELSDDSDWTSSSGSESSSDSGSDDDSAPEEVTSRRQAPERVPPPPRQTNRKPCRHFKAGHCARGDKCNFSHEVPARGVKSKPVDEKRRKGLLQAVSILHHCFMLLLT